jgi:adenosylhomocysteinase
LSIRPPDVDLQRELRWLETFTPATSLAASRLPPLVGERILLVCHLDVKMVPVFEALAEAGAELYARAANPATTRNAVAEHLRSSLGVDCPAHEHDPPERHEAYLQSAVEAGPTLLSEMGAEASAATGGRLASVRGALEATGTGVRRLRDLDLRYPVFDWDAVPIKQGLHNQHLVGLMALNTFLDVTGLSVYGKTVLVLGYGPVGRGVADAARSFGAAVEVLDPSPAARLAAAHSGYPTPDLTEALPGADLVITATGRDGALPAEDLALLKDGAFLANVGHTSAELPVAELKEHVKDTPRPHVERCEWEGKTFYLLAGGAMFNLAAGPGDPYDTFDLVTALMLEATSFLATEGTSYPPGLHLLPKKVQDATAHLYLKASRRDTG